MPNPKKIDHRGALKGVVGEVRKELKEKGEEITLPAVSYRIKMRRHKETMRIYRERLQARQAEMDVVERELDSIDALIDEIRSEQP